MTDLQTDTLILSKEQVKAALTQSLLVAYTEIENSKSSIKDYKEEAMCTTDQQKGLLKEEVTLIDKAVKAYVADNFDKNKESWQEFEAQYKETSKLLDSIS